MNTRLEVFGCKKNEKWMSGLVLKSTSVSILHYDIATELFKSTCDKVIYLKIIFYKRQNGRGSWAVLISESIGKYDWVENRQKATEENVNVYS